MIIKKNGKDDLRNLLYSLILLMFCQLIIVTSVSNAQTSTNFQRQIDRDGKITKSNYNRFLREKHGAITRRKISTTQTTGIKPCSTINTVGDQPENFGTGFNWCANDKEVLLVAFINSANYLGVAISGAKRGDTIEITSASGISSFSEDKGNPLIAGLIGLAGRAGKIAAPEYAPYISAAEEFAKDQFKPTNAKTKRRDAFGVDPGTGHKARQEGGVVVTLPSQGGPVYSGNDDAQNRWIKANEYRFDQYRPSHALSSFFLVQGVSYNTRTVDADGEIYLLAWDHKFEDNAGYYKVFIHLKRGNPTPSEVIEKRRNN